MQLGLVVRRESLLQIERTEDQQMVENTEELQAVVHTEELRAVARTEERQAAVHTEELRAVGHTEERQAAGHTEEPQAAEHNAGRQAVGSTAGLQLAAWNSSSTGLKQEVQHRNFRPRKWNESQLSYWTWCDWLRRTYPAEEVGRRNLSKTGYPELEQVDHHCHLSLLFECHARMQAWLWQSPVVLLLTCMDLSRCRRGQSFRKELGGQSWLEYQAGRYC